MSEVGRISPRVRLQMVEDLQKRGIKNTKVLEVMQTIRRHDFVEHAFQHRAYDNDALPIGNKQTISQPYIVAKMTEALLSAEGEMLKVLEIGTGSGYQAAVLSRLVRTVYSVERIAKLIPRAKEALQKNKINNVYVRHADGYQGWNNKQPFDGIMVTAASQGVPEVLYDQLRMGGKIVIPVGEINGDQDLIEITKTPEGHAYKFIEKVRFVPMLHGEQK